MSTILQASERMLQNSNLRQLRNQGNIPAVVYGTKVESKPVYVNAADFLKTIRDVGRNGVISLEVSGNRQDVVLTDYQEDPIKRQIVHVDFLAVDQSTEINADVRVALIGDAAGVKDGGVMQQPLHTLSVTATPNNIPASIEVDVTSLQVGENLTIGDIKSNKDYQINHEEEEVIVSILPPKQEEEISTGEQQEGGIPENEEGRETQASKE